MSESKAHAKSFKYRDMQVKSLGLNYWQAQLIIPLSPQKVKIKRVLNNKLSRALILYFWMQDFYPWKVIMYRQTDILDL